MVHPAFGREFIALTPPAGGYAGAYLSRRPQQRGDRRAWDSTCLESRVYAVSSRLKAELRAVSSTRTHQIRMDGVLRPRRAAPFHAGGRKAANSPNTAASAASLSAPNLPDPISRPSSWQGGHGAKSRTGTGLGVASGAPRETIRFRRCRFLVRRRGRFGSCRFVWPPAGPGRRVRRAVRRSNRRGGNWRGRR